MDKALIIYGSTTGNTETLSGYVAEGLRRGSFEVEVRNVAETDPEEMLGFDLVLLGCSTWDDGELQEDFVDFADELAEVDLKGCKSACFGPGDSSYDAFCKAVDTLAHKLRARGATVLGSLLKIDGEVENYQEQATSWGAEIARLSKQ